MIISRLLLLRPVLRNGIKQRIKYCTIKTDAEIEKEKELERIANDLADSYRLGSRTPPRWWGTTFSSEQAGGEGKYVTTRSEQASIDEPPTACCQSGCTNCVFIVWAETLTKKMDNVGPEIAEKILKSVEDPSLRAYLELELRMRLKK